jgi:hypothetical protein
VEKSGKSLDEMFRIGLICRRQVHPVLHRESASQS